MSLSLLCPTRKAVHRRARAVSTTCDASVLSQPGLLVQVIAVLTALFVLET